MAKDLNRQPLDLEPMVALSTDIRKKYGKDPDKSQGADIRRNWNEALDTIEKFAVTAAEEDPAQLAEDAKMVRDSVRSRRQWLRNHLRDRFSIEVRPASWLPDEKKLSIPPFRIIDRERLRALLEDVEANRETPLYADMLGLLQNYETLERAWWGMEYARRQSYLAGLAGEVIARYKTAKYVKWGIKRRVVSDWRSSDPDKAALLAYVIVMRNAPIGYASFVSRGGDAPFQKRLQEAATGMLSGWVRSETKLYQDLREALAEEGNPQEVLLEQLPNALLAVLAELDRDTLSAEVERLRERSAERADMYKVLVNSVANHLRTSGSALLREARERARKEGSELHGARPGVSGREEQEEDPDIEDVELRLTMHQEHDRLRSWVERANFSEREAQVYELDMRTDSNTNAIAHELEMPPKKVRDYRSRYLAKLRKVAGF